MSSKCIFTGATTLSITTFSITTLSIMGLVTTLSIDIQHNSIECHDAECCYDECRDYLNVMLSVIMLNVIMPSGIRLNAAMLEWRSAFLLYILVHSISMI